MAFVKEHAPLPWTTGHAELGKIGFGQRLNKGLESMENLCLYSQQLFEHDKQQDQEIQDLKIILGASRKKLRC